MTTPHSRPMLAALFVAMLTGCPAPSAGTDGGAGLDVGGSDAGGADAAVDAAITGFDAALDASASPSDADVPVDAGGPTAAERTACTTLLSIAPCGTGSTDEMACLAGFVDLRSRVDAACSSDYDAWVSCISTLTACPSGSGVLCPTEYGALGACLNPPP